MQAAFVEIGLSRTAFLHANDIISAKKEASDTEPSISELLHEGQMITVQVMKDMLGSKGARLTTDLSIPRVFWCICLLVSILAFHSVLKMKQNVNA
jgi:ribonuclease G